jgi:SAM-dependent methyltransferase
LNRRERKHPARLRFRPEDTRASYDKVAHRYADEIAGELDNKPFDRQFLDRFAGLVAGKGRVVELGCGPSHVAAFLADRGVDMGGLDLSPAMVAEAHRLFPNLDVQVGSMLELPYSDGSIAGLVAFYSIIHFDDDQLRTCFAEMARLLVPGGLVALAFHVGDGVVHRGEWWGQPVALDARSLLPNHVIALLADAGLAVVSLEERDPYAPEVEYQSHRAYIVARKARPLAAGIPDLPPFELGYARTDMRRKLVDAVLRGDKAGTAGLATDFAPHTADPLPQPGDRWLLVGYEDEPIASVETTEVRVVRAGEIDLQFARDGVRALSRSPTGVPPTSVSGRIR